MIKKKALILIPCCREKKVSPVDYKCDSAIDGLESLRIGLRQNLEGTPALASYPQNHDGILKDNAPKTQARVMYVGTIFEFLRGLWDTTAANIVIVSAAYGLVKPTEAIKQYELQMGDGFSNGKSVKAYWKVAGLPKMLENYVRANAITHIWSLLPDSNTSESRTPYHSVFQAYWNNVKKRERCFWVKVYIANNVSDRNSNKVISAGRGSMAKRGEWLAEILRNKPELLTKDLPSDHKFKRIPGFTFHYCKC